MSKTYRCFIPTRKPYQKGYLKTQATPGAIELIEFNTKNFSEIENAIKNSDVVINLIGILYETRKQKFTKIHSDIPDIVSKLCAKHKVKKFIQVSAIGSNKESKLRIKDLNFHRRKISYELKNTVILRPSVVRPRRHLLICFQIKFFPNHSIIGINYNFQPIMNTIN